VTALMIELDAELKPAPAAAEMADGWRGLLDFGEMWQEADAEQWQADWGAMPVGEPLLYGCEARRAAVGNETRWTLRLWALDEPRPVMTAERVFTLRDGGSDRAVGRLLGS
jgi:hypothetical protein